MKSIRTVRIIVALICVAAPPARGEQGTASIEQLAVQLKALQAEVLELRLEIQTTKVARLGGELAAARNVRQRLESWERSINEEISNMDRQLTAPDLTPEQRAEVDIHRSELSGKDVPKIRQQRLEAEQRELEIAQDLRAANEKMTAIHERLKQQH